jgi:hypothetical protein
MRRLGFQPAKYFRSVSVFLLSASADSLECGNPDLQAPVILSVGLTLAIGVDKTAAETGPLPARRWDVTEFFTST